MLPHDAGRSERGGYTTKSRRKSKAKVANSHQAAPPITKSAVIRGLQLTLLSQPKLLIIDELGYLPFKADAAHLLFQLVFRRYEKGSILITSNRSVGEWGGVFRDPIVATAILDRLLHYSAVITIRGDSCRLREKRRSGLLRRPERRLKPTKHRASEGGQFLLSLDTSRAQTVNA